MMNDGPATVDGIERVLVVISRIAQFFTTVLMVVMTVIISWQIFGRYLLNDTPKWSEQLAGILMVYMTMIGGALALRENRHIALTYFRDRWPLAVRARARLVSYLLVAAFGAMMAVYGVRMTQLVQAWTIPTLGISQSLNYWSFPVAGLLIFVFALDKLRRPGPSD
jgi:TRAP-type C4-dicarboxylate transport system permease small subunit